MENYPFNVCFYELRQQSLVRNPMFGALDNTTRYTPIVMAAEAYEIYEINFFFIQ